MGLTAKHCRSIKKGRKMISIYEIRGDKGCTYQYKREARQNTINIIYSTYGRETRRGLSIALKLQGMPFCSLSHVGCLSNLRY